MSFSYGRMTFSVQGNNLSRFISRCARDGIKLADVTYSRSGKFPSVIVTVPLHSAKPLLSVARECRMRVRTVRRSGLFTFFGRIKKRPVLAAGAFLACAALFIISHFIWVIDVQGAYSIPRERIYDLLTDAGIHAVMPRDKEYINGQMALFHAKDMRIAHASALVEGVKLTVTISEAVPNGAQTAEHNVLYAKCDGVIEEVLTYSGKALVKKGDVVHRGDILITGDLSTEDKEIHVPASGKVTAKIGHTFFGTAPERLPAKVRSGKSRRVIEVRIFGHKIIKPFFDEYEAEYDGKSVHTGILLPVTFRSATMYELTDGYAKAKLSEQKETAEDAAYASMLRSLDKSARIISKNTVFEKASDGTVTAELNVVTVEQIVLLD